MTQTHEHVCTHMHQHTNCTHTHRLPCNTLAYTSTSTSGISMPRNSAYLIKEDITDYNSLVLTLSCTCTLYIYMCTQCTCIHVYTNYEHVHVYMYIIHYEHVHVDLLSGDLCDICSPLRNLLLLKHVCHYFDL